MAQPIANLSLLGNEDLAWSKLPEELTVRIKPFMEVNDLRLKIGKTSNQQEYLELVPRRNTDLSLGVRPQNSKSVGYVVLSKKGYYWPDRHLLRLENDIIVSASSCRLEGSSFDIHLLHDTARLVGDNMVISLPEGLKPIESNSVRISGLGGATVPVFEWDPPQVPASPIAPQASAAPNKKEPRKLEVEIQGKEGVRFEGKPVTVEAFRSRVREIAGTDPDASFVVLQGPMVSAFLQDKVVGIIEESGFNVLERKALEPSLETHQLRPEVEETMVEIPVTHLPSGEGARFLWVAGEGKYVLNGVVYSEGPIRQVLRKMGREDPATPMVVAGPRSAPPSFFQSMIEDLRSFGFQQIQIGVEAAGWRP